jgi:heterodisulfide reductase subunit D
LSRRFFIKMRQELILQHKLQKALWCKKLTCPSIHDRWVGLRDEITAHADEQEVLSIIKTIIHKQHNLFGYPNEERGLWLEFEKDNMRQYCEKEKAEVVYFVGCKTSFIISAQQTAVNMLKELIQLQVDFAVLGEREWCCGMPIKKLKMNTEFENCRQHNIQQIQKLGAKRIIFSCKTCYLFWQKEYQLEGIELIRGKNEL